MGDYKITEWEEGEGGREDSQNWSPNEQRSQKKRGGGPVGAQHASEKAFGSLQSSGTANNKRQQFAHAVRPFVHPSIGASVHRGTQEVTARAPASFLSRPPFPSCQMSGGARP